MNTKTDDADLEIPEITDFSGFGPSRYGLKPGELVEIRIDGAVGYRLRLVPSGKIVGRFPSTLDAWPAVLREVERGIPARCLILDWCAADGRTGRVSSGRSLEYMARTGLGMDAEYLRARWERRRTGLPASRRADPPPGLRL